MIDPSRRPAAFRLRAASAAFDGATVLREVELAIEPGEIVAVVGPSGAGKTTLLRLLNATVFPSSGSVQVDGVELAQLSPKELRAVRSRIGFVHQDHSLVPNLRVSANVLAGRLGQRGFLSAARSMLLPAQADLEIAHDLLERVGIPEKLFERTDTLSGGQQQRVAIARALFQEPVALLADEPVASVDPARARDVVALLRDLALERGITLVVSLHDRELAREFFPRTIGLRAGTVHFDAPTDTIDSARYRALFQLE